MNTVLVANRGEIALRVMRTAKAMGLRTVAVFSDADAEAPHVRVADDAVRLGPAPAAESYLNAGALLAAARATGADAVHPGYGFLAENAGFARAVIDAGLTWIGPPPAAIEAMGDKARAKRAMIAAGVPCVPGWQGEAQDLETLTEAAREVGLPLMVKASAGGGGKGMRVVREAEALAAALERARAEAEASFGDGALILERAVETARHVEIQVMADAQGNVVHLGERDCSVQRRHQKVIEEAPAPGMTEALRAAMGAAAVEAARAVGYAGAGTVEFLLAPSGEFFFLEMNTRLQVEHPVTEMVTGLDLVALQFRIARGEALPLSQDEVALRGHAVEARLYAEDPAQGFLPSPGPVRLWAPPEGARVDAGIETGGAIPGDYDPMAAKIVASGPDRDAARRALIRALEETALFGPRTNRDFLLDVLEHPVFAAGEATTGFLDAEWPEGWRAPAPGPADLALAAALRAEGARREALETSVLVSPELIGWSSAAPLSTVYAFDGADGPVEAHLTPEGAGWRATLGEAAHRIEVLEMAGPRARIRIDGIGRTVHVDAPDRRVLEVAARRTHRVEELSAGGGEAAGSGEIRAPMHGRLVALSVAEGAEVAAGDRLAVMEAMKMQHEITAPVAGRVAAISAAEGAQLAADDPILTIEEDAG